MTAPIALICKVLFPFISTFETPPLVDQVQQLCCPLFQAVWAKLGSKRRLWERMRALFYDYVLDSMRHLFEALLYGWKKTAPIFAVDSS